MHRQLAPAQLASCSTELKLRAALAIYAALWTTTALAAAAVALTPGLARDARASLHGLGLDLRPHAATLHALLLTRLARNMAIAAAPTEWAAIGAGRCPRCRRVIDAILTATLLTDAAFVGVALGAFGVRLVAWLPHLPLEWAALAVGVLPWLAARRGQQRRVDLLAPLAVCFVLLLAAACVETWLTPHT